MITSRPDRPPPPGGPSRRPPPPGGPSKRGPTPGGPAAALGDTGSQLEWRVDGDPVDYPAAVAAMEARAAAVAAGAAPELLWLLDHPSIYTAGTSARPEHLLAPDRFPVHRTGRGGQYAYHGPGQRIGYAVLDLTRRGRDVRDHVRRLEDWLIRTLALFDIRGERRADRVGVWVVERGQDMKIAAIGVRVRRWVAYHGVALNVSPDLDCFAGIVPCGLDQYGVTSLAALGVAVSRAEIDAALRASAGGLAAAPLGRSTAPS